jgi:hypothetical protein
MRLRTFLASTHEWIFCSAAMASARAEQRQRGAPAERAAQQARLLIEVARRADESVKTLPSGSRTAVLFGLYRDAIYWALVARSNAGPTWPDLAALWGRHLGSATGEEDGLALAALSPSLAPSLDVSDDQEARARSLAERLVLDLDAPRWQVERVRVRRAMRGLLVGAALVLVGLGVRTLALGPNLAAGKPFRTSSTYAGCLTDPLCADLLFHTNTEANPWVEFDLGSARQVSRVEVKNRSDCCGDRAVPLVLELGEDRASFRQVARRDTLFSTWTATFHEQTARYVRLTAQKQTALHLEAVAVR